MCVCVCVCACVRVFVCACVHVPRRRVSKKIDAFPDIDAKKTNAPHEMRVSKKIDTIRDSCLSVSIFLDSLIWAQALHINVSIPCLSVSILRVSKIPIPCLFFVSIRVYLL